VRRTHRDHQQFHQIVLDIPCLSRLANPDQYLGQPNLAFRLHGTPQKDRKLHKSNPWNPGG
jgi:hypothetical protein